MLATVFSVLLVGAAALSAPLCTAHDVRALTPAAAAAGRSVHLRGVITFSTHPHEYFYLQDPTGGVRVEWAKCDRTLKPGDAAEVTGKTDAGLFLPKIRAGEVKATPGSRERLPIPEPFNLTADESYFLDGQWVAAETVVQNVWSPEGPWLKADLARGRGNVVAYVPRPLGFEAEKARELRGAVVRVRGVWELGPGGTSPSHLLVTDLEEFRTVEFAKGPGALPLVTSRDLNQIRSDPISARLPVRVKGVVTLDQVGRHLYIQDETGVINVRFREPVAVQTGQGIVAFGFPRAAGTTDPPLVENAGLLSADPVKPGERFPLPAAVPGTPADALAGKLEGRVARFGGLVHAAEKQDGWQTFTLLVDKHTFTVVMEEPIPAPEPGSRVEVVGTVTRQQFAKFPRHTFAVVVRAKDVTVLAGPPAPPHEPTAWWSGHRAAYLSAGFLGMFLLAGATVTALRVQVRRARELARKRTEEKKQLEGQLDRASRLETVGRVAGGVAHDFNNILTVINGCAQLLDEGRADDPTRAATLADIRRAGRLAVVLTRLLLAFSRQRQVPRHPLDLNALVADADPILARLLGPRTVLCVAPGSALPPVLAESGRLLQILINLAVNAAEAMPNGGTFSITTSAPQPGWVRLIAADTGTGMSADVRARAFERGFTTKAEGTGTGLATVSDAVSELGGTIRCRSELGRGTEFEIDLPAAPAALVAGGPAGPPGTPLARPAGEARIDAAAAGSKPAPRSPVVLLVEDDDAVRCFVSHVLDRAGLGVISAAEPEEALRTLVGCGPVDLLLTDVLLPGFSGWQLAERVRELYPGVRVLFVSGQPSDEAAPGASDFLHKPFTPRELTERVWRLLGQPG